MVNVPLNGAKTIYIKGKSECVKFGRQGGLWAALESSGKSINVYEMWSFECALKIVIQSGRFEHFEWANQDLFILTCSSDGLVAVWSRFTANRLFEYVDKRTHFKTLTGNYTIYQKPLN